MSESTVAPPAGSGPSTRSTGAGPTAPEPRLKRPLDILLSSMGLVLSSPLWLLCAVWIKLDDGGPIFYEQDRWGYGGSRLKVTKFRTMRSDSDRRFGLRQAREDDDRVTRAGRVLRAMGLDELPQLLNILKGEMSLVGPRPLAIGELVQGEDGRSRSYEDVAGFEERLSVRPGLTSLSTVYRPKDTSPERKFQHDLVYVRNRSLALDLRLIALSLWISVRGRWEDRDSKLRP